MHDITGPVPIEYSRLLSEGSEVEVVFDGRAREEYLRLETDQQNYYRIRLSGDAKDLHVYFTGPQGDPTRWYSYDEWDYQDEFLRVLEPGELIFRPPHSGTYYLAVASIDPTLVANYTIRLDSLLAPAPEFFSPQTLEVGQTIAGSIHQNENDRFFRFSAVEGAEYEFDIVGMSYSGSVKLLAEDGHTPVPIELFNFRLDEQENYNHLHTFTWTAPASGVYYIALESETVYSISASIAPVIPDEEPDRRV